MRKIALFIVMFGILGVALTACGTPPSLRSEKYLKDDTLLNIENELAFHGITPGKTTFTDAIAKIKADAAFGNIQSQDKPPAASWSVKDGEVCCQLSANADTGIVDALMIRLATPGITAKQIIEKFKEPQYVNYVDYSEKEVAIAMIYPERGLVIWAVPGDSTSTLEESSPVVMALILDPKDWKKIQDQATLQKWAGFLKYQEYKNATPVITPAVTPTAP